jgi:hypothetical protein
VQAFESSPGFERRFCRRCGSVVPGRAGDGHVFAPTGGVEDSPGMRANAHIFVASKAPWYRITDELRQFDAFPRAEGPAEITAGTHAPEGVALGGSCLCGAVAFEVTAPLDGARNCHCTRCRRGRAAAHAANGFTRADGVRFLRGEESIGSYKVPEAQFFTQAFCRTCGGIVPRIDPERGLAVIPLGTLDGTPDRTPQEHIFVGSKAGWFEITDDLPRFEERPT